MVSLLLQCKISPKKITKMTDNVSKLLLDLGQHSVFPLAFGWGHSPLQNVPPSEAETELLPSPPCRLSEVRTELFSELRLLGSKQLESYGEWPSQCSKSTARRDVANRSVCEMLPQRPDKSLSPRGQGARDPFLCCTDVSPSRAP